MRLRGRSIQPACLTGSTGFNCPAGFEAYRYIVRVIILPGARDIHSPCALRMDLLVQFPLRIRRGGGTIRYSIFSQRCLVLARILRNFATAHFLLFFRAFARWENSGLLNETTPLRVQYHDFTHEFKRVSAVSHESRWHSNKIKYLTSARAKSVRYWGSCRIWKIANT